MLRSIDDFMDSERVERDVTLVPAINAACTTHARSTLLFIRRKVAFVLY